MIDPDFFFFYAGQLYEGYDEEYECPVLDEDRVSSCLKLSIVVGFILVVKNVFRISSDFPPFR